MGGGDQGRRGEDLFGDRVDEGSPDVVESTRRYTARWHRLGRAVASAASVRDRIAGMSSFVKGAVAAAALVVVSVAVAPGLTSGGPGARVEAPPSSSVPGPGPAQKPPGAPHLLPTGRYAVEHVAGAVPFSFAVPEKRVEWADAWTGFGDLYISLNSVGPQSAEAVIYWTGFTASSDGVGVEACGQWWGPPVGRTAADLAIAASSATGTEIVARPADVTVGGYAAKRVVLAVRADVDCQPGLLYTWPTEAGGPFWPGANVGDTVRIWIVDVDGALLYVAGITRRHAGPAVGREVEQIIESICFDEPDPAAGDP